MSTTDDGDDGPVYGPGSFVHLDVTSAYSRLASPNTPLEYVTALTRQFPLNEDTPVDQPRPAIALADHGLQSAVKMAVACAQAGVEHLCGVRVRLVPEASKRTFFFCEFHPNNQTKYWLWSLPDYSKVRRAASSAAIRGPRTQATGPLIPEMVRPRAR